MWTRWQINVVNRKGRQMMILCVHVDFYDYCVSVHLQQSVTPSEDSRSLWAAVKPGPETKQQTSVRFTLSIRKKKQKKKNRKYDSRKLRSVKLSVGLVEIHCIIVYRFPFCKVEYVDKISRRKCILLNLYGYKWILFTFKICYRCDLFH